MIECIAQITSMCAQGTVHIWVFSWDWAIFYFLLSFTWMYCSLQTILECTCQSLVGIELLFWVNKVGQLLYSHDRTVLPFGVNKAWLDRNSLVSGGGGKAIFNHTPSCADDWLCVWHHKTIRTIIISLDGAIHTLDRGV